MANVPVIISRAIITREGASPILPGASEDPALPVNPDGTGNIPPVDGSYADQATMIADQANQLAQYIYYDGTSYWEYLGTTVGTIADYREISGGGGGGGDFVSYDVADGKNATEKQQARDNIGSTAGIATTNVETGNINKVAKTSNIIYLTGATANRNCDGIDAGVDGELCLLWNKTAFIYTLRHQASAPPAGQFFFSNATNLTMTAGMPLMFRYDGVISRWRLEQNLPLTYIRKDRDDITNFAVNFQGSQARVKARPNDNQPFQITNITDVVWLRARTNSSTVFGNDAIFEITNYRTSGNSLAFSVRQNDGTVTLQVLSTGQMRHARSESETGSVRRDELPFNYPETVATTGTINDLALDNEGVKLLILTQADDLTGVVPVTTTTGRELKIEGRNAGGVIIRHESASSTAANRFSLPGATDLTIANGEVYTFIYTNGRWRRAL
jgi:hypothetical protein